MMTTITTKLRAVLLATAKTAKIAPPSSKNEKNDKTLVSKDYDDGKN